MTEDNRTTESLLARRELAEKATPGPWKPGTSVFLKQETIIASMGYIAAEPIGVSYPTTCYNFAHIAANSPDVVMADIDEILRLRAQVERLEKEADWLAEYCWKKPEAEYHPLREMRGGFYCGTCPHDHDCRKCWREAARKAVEEMK